MSTNDIFELTYFSLFMILVLVVFIKIIYSRYGKNKKATAIVIGKNIDNFDDFDLAKGYERNQINYIITFNINGTTKNFFVGSGFFNSLKEGDKGILYYKGNMVIDFISIENDGETEF